MLDAHRKALRRGEYYQESVEGLPLADTGDDPVTQLDQKQRVDRLLGSLGQLQESVTTDEASGSHEQTTYVVNQDRSVPELLVRILIGKP
ncbi:MAG: hypothetical protein E8D42_08740 [Nitrospira sp.]|jgi:hypothetical protein|nr:MAG: hypothetical protein E8D42_08740 [Nitrospira sp.]